MFDWDAYKKRVEWFTNARFGMFIHWGLYSIPARGEWVRSQERITVEDYQKYFDEFNPVDYDPKAWARLAKQAGMKYAVLTSKHHDGFCLFDSKLTDYKSTNTPARRDLVREYLEAFRAEGIKVGLYYSLIDWHHPDYPHYGDRQHPMRDNPDFKDHTYNLDNYINYMHGQVRELLTNYGKLDIMWFDFSYNNAVGPNMSGETWRATELTDMIRTLQPGILIDNRMEVSGEGFGSLLTGDPSAYSGDFVSPEQIIPPEGIFDSKGQRVVWEACATLNNHWGYAASDQYWKPAPMVVRKLVECVSKGGNFLLNIGPDARGVIPPESQYILEEVGQWMKLNGASVYGCGCADLPKPDFGRYTRGGSKLYAHVFDNSLGLLPLLGFKKGAVKQARLLATGAELSAADDWTSSNYSDAFVNLGPNPVLPDEIDTVIELTLN
jgi:alpha-L-fucosidase